MLTSQLIMAEDTLQKMKDSRAKEQEARAEKLMTMNMSINGANNEGLKTVIWAFKYVVI